MNVGELIAALQAQDPDLPVIMPGEDVDFARWRQCSWTRSGSAAESVIDAFIDHLEVARKLLVAHEVQRHLEDLPRK